MGIRKRTDVPPDEVPLPMPMPPVPVPAPPPGPRLANPSADSDLRATLIEARVLVPNGRDIRDEMLTELLRDRPCLRLDDEGRREAANSLGRVTEPYRPRRQGD
jgi:hypothetical protein